MRMRPTIAATLAVCLLMAGGVSLADSTADASRGDRGTGRDSFTFAVIGDIPYGDAQFAAFPGRIDQLNADRQVQLVDHLGDIKSGSSVCSDDYFAADPDAVRPVHRSPGLHTGRQRMDRLPPPEQRRLQPAGTPGQGPRHLLPRSRPDPRPAPGEGDLAGGSRLAGERALRPSQVSFAAVHIVGSNNSLAPWTGNTAPTPEQTSEVLGRTAADIGLIRGTFTHARSTRARAVVLLTQADMFDPTVTGPQFSDYFGFQPIVRAIAEESARFTGPVYLFNGDSHVFNQDHPSAGVTMAVVLRRQRPASEPHPRHRRGVDRRR